MSECRFCRTRLQHLFVDLGKSPLCESFLAPDQLNAMEPFYSLRAFVCDHCFLVQVEDHVMGESTTTLFAAPELARRLKRRFPGSLTGAPFLDQRA